MKNCLVLLKKSLGLINFIVLFLYVFCLLLSYVSERYFGQISLWTLKTFSCKGCLDTWGATIAAKFLGLCFCGALLISSIIFFVFKKLYKNQKSYCPVFLFVLYLGMLNWITWRILSSSYQLGLSHIIVVFCLAGLFYIFNLNRQYKARYLFILLMICLPAVLGVCATQQPLLFFSYKGMQKLHNLDTLVMKNQRNLIVVYVESFNEDFRSIDEDNKNYQVDDKDAVRFAYFKQGADQAATKPALVSSFTGVFPLYSSPQKGIGRILANNGYQNLFLQSGDVDFTGTREFLIKAGFPSQNIYGGADIKDISACKLKKHSSHWNDMKEVFRRWNGVCDIVAFNEFQLKINNLDKNEPFFAVMFTLDLHSGDNPFYKNMNEEKVANIINLNNFIRWFRKQDFYPNTTLIILADHNRFRSGKASLKPLYNAFFNLPDNLKQNLNINRTFNQTDMFLTMLEIAGFDLPFTQYGYSTSIFSTDKTIAEKYKNEELIDTKEINLLDLVKKSKVIWTVSTEIIRIFVNNKKVFCGA